MSRIPPFIDDAETLDYPPRLFLRNQFKCDAGSLTECHAPSGSPDFVPFHEANNERA